MVLIMLALGLAAAPADVAIPLDAVHVVVDAQGAKLGAKLLSLPSDENPDWNVSELKPVLGSREHPRSFVLEIGRGAKNEALRKLLYTAENANARVIIVTPGARRGIDISDRPPDDGACVGLAFELGKDGAVLQVQGQFAALHTCPAPPNEVGALYEEAVRLRPNDLCPSVRIHTVDAVETDALMALVRELAARGARLAIHIVPTFNASLAAPDCKGASALSDALANAKAHARKPELRPATTADGPR